jgi:hypothetical protein
VAGISSGNLGQALRAGATTLISAVGMNVVGSATGNILFAGASRFVNVVGHALVGCFSAVGSGSTCQSGALAGGVTSAAGPVINRMGFAAGLAANSVLGGLVSVAGGGKFANGAITGTFGYLYNYCAHLATCTREEAQQMEPAGAVDTLSPLDFINPVRLVGGLIGIGIRIFAEDALVTSARGVGAAGEAAVRGAFNIGEKSSIEVNGTVRFPDGLTSRVLSEVKNVKSLSYTRQLQDYSVYAADKPLRFDLYVRPTTSLSPSLQDAIKSGMINLKYIPQ